MDALTAAWLIPVATYAPAPIAADNGWTGMAGISGVLLSASIIAALITGTINLTLARRRSREEERARVRNTFAEAYKAYSEYREFPNAVRGRISLAKARAALRRPQPDGQLAELERLDVLHRSGSLDDAEFAAAKQRVLTQV